MFVKAWENRTDVSGERWEDVIVCVCVARIRAGLDVMEGIVTILLP